MFLQAYNRSDVGFTKKRIAYTQRQCGGYQGFLELLADVLVNDEPLGSSAALTTETERRSGQFAGYFSRVCIRHDNDAVIAPQFSLERFGTRGAEPGDLNASAA